MRQIFFGIAIALLPALLIAGCARTPARYSRLLTLADSLAECGHPDSALRILSEVPPESLSGSDRALHALLTVKATDKAFTPHTFDSTISIALSHFRANGPTLRRAEAVYYHGRVLSDLGDYANALDAYDDALTTLSPDTTRRAIRLRSHILSQNAQLLENLRLYPEAIPFYRTAINISISIGDSTDAVLDILSCSFCLMQLDSLDSAEAMLAKAYPLLPNLSPSDRAEVEISRRDLLRTRHHYAAAISGIDTVLAQIEPQFREFGYRVASDAYHALGQRDSAGKYVRLWLDASSPQSKSKAYRMLTENAIADHDFQTADTMFRLYVAQIGSKLMENSAVPVTVTGYRNRAYRSELLAESLRQRNLLLFIIIIIISVILISLLFNIRFYKELTAMNLLVYWMRNKQTDTDQTLPLPAIRPPGEGKHPAFQPTATTAISEIRQQIITTVCQKMNQPLPDNTALSDTQLCLTIRNMAAKNQNIPDQSELWSQIEDLVRSASPCFISNLNILFGKYNDVRFRVCMLILIGLRPSDIAVLMAKNLNGITYHRNQICKEAFDSRVKLSGLADAICILASL
ncbi:MAG: hypothetical protein HDR77_11350 [Bacteroides sp.]|nr:hypothetical protein [Bacteroides sp.]MBD5376050.1 hypothetical protein [Bacteroides sp.]